MGMMKDLYHDEICANSEEALAEQEHADALAELYASETRGQVEANTKEKNTK